MHLYEVMLLERDDISEATEYLVASAREGHADANIIFFQTSS